MDNILIGSNPSTQAVTGVVSNQVMNDQVPLSKSNRAVPPGKIGVPLKNAKYRIIENKNLPLIPFLRNMDKGGDELPFGDKAQLSLHRVMFGTMNVFDVELTGELVSGLVGKAQGFYVVSSKDASSHTMMFTAVFNSENFADTLSFFGVCNAAVSESQLAITGGTGKYTSAKGFAIITAITSTNHSIADEAKSLLRFSVFLA
ncbi:hypothetical protein MKW98_013307 [Papaver atlanticum]|uniref:Dirigent protein n=1 Tax=Papaver atlanticum TaxID=357466 RepID=A0AAD4SHC4_9MAGN|nr:hypothetical protein MKW98_013307 [Papaver atlanticum]